MRSALIAFLAFTSASPGSGQSPVSTDRPAVTASSVVVPAGSLQLENGLAQTANQGKSTFDGSETLVRFGVLSKTELRFAAPNFFLPEGEKSGFGDLSVGVKQQLGPAGGFDLAAIISVSLPVGAHAFSSHGYDPSVQVPWSRAFAGNWTAAGMLAVYWPTQGDRRNVTGQATALINRQFKGRWDVFVEYAGDFPEEGRPRNLAHFGVAHRVTPGQQIDLHVGAGLSTGATDYFIGVGYSFRWQALRR